jgi:hypothetical protein
MMLINYLNTLFSNIENKLNKKKKKEYFIILIILKNTKFI